jgi:antitoxin CcdA
MNPHFHYVPTPKKPTNVSISDDLLKQARLLHINLSQTLEERLAELISKARAEQWLKENRNAIDEYNNRIEKEGLFSDGVRQF